MRPQPGWTSIKREKAARYRACQSERRQARNATTTSPVRQPQWICCSRTESMTNFSSGNHPAIVSAVESWLDKAVIGLNLCPFARAVQVRQQIRYTVTEATEPAQLVEALTRELSYLHACDPQATDTTLLIHPWVLEDFSDYNEFLDVADVILDGMGLDGDIQIASFHPDYQFSGTHRDDVSNYTNRSPYPILQLLREDSISRAVASVPDTDIIYKRNIATLKKLGKEGWLELFNKNERPSV
jgi:uncharacterized protein